MEKTEKGSKWGVSTFLWTLLVIAVVGYFLWWGWYDWEHKVLERNNVAHGNVSEGKIIPHIDQPKKDVLPCECKKEKLKRKKPKTKVKPEPAPEQEPKAEQKVSVSVPDFYDKAVMPKTWVTEPEEEVVPERPPKVGRKIYVVRQPSPYYYGGGYGYNYGYAPSVIYGGTPTFVPNPPVIVPAPSVVTPPPSVVTPAGGYKPQGNTGGHSPSGVTL